MTGLQGFFARQRIDIAGRTATRLEKYVILLLTVVVLVGIGLAVATGLVPGYYYLWIMCWVLLVLSLLSLTLSFVGALKRSERVLLWAMISSSFLLFTTLAVAIVFVVIASMVITELPRFVCDDDDCEQNFTTGEKVGIWFVNSGIAIVTFLIPVSLEAGLIYLTSEVRKFLKLRYDEGARQRLIQRYIPSATTTSTYSSTARTGAPLAPAYVFAAARE
ncbi:hypothetical protein QOT17_015472 [Balamuthia mandrillaris]